MKNYERESLVKSFSLFFSVQLIFLSLVMYQNYHKILHEYDMKVGHTMMQCHLDIQCNTFETFLMKDIKEKKLHTFYRDDTVYMLFKKKNQYEKMITNTQSYLSKQNKIKQDALLEYFLYFLVLLLESLLFAFYAMRPLKQALQLNEEFVKDILHDFNTPLSALKINLKILKKKFGNDNALERSEESIQNILSLQDNLHYYINQNKRDNEKVNLHEIIQERVHYFQALYPNLDISYDVETTSIYSIKNVLIRIIDNLLSNASKYNKENGAIKIQLKSKLLSIEDTGIGIKNPQDIFQRYYKENTKGIGIGLHIVHKLCEELHISIKVESSVHIGSKFILDLTRLN